MASYQLRAARDDDRERIARLWHVSASLPDVGPPEMPPYAVFRAWVDTELAAGWVVTVIEAERDLIGFVAIKPEERILAELFICPGHLGQGFGKVLLDHAKGAMPEGFMLYTTAANARARHFYEREGLSAERAGQHPRAGHPIIWYRWAGRSG